MDFKVDIKIAPWLMNGIDWSKSARARAGKKGAEAAVKYMRAHAPIRTGRLRASWRYSTARGYNYTKREYVIHLENDAHEIRRSGDKYYAVFVEHGFHHVWQNMRWHPGHNDRFGAAREAAKAIAKSLEADWKSDAKMRKGVSGGQVKRE